MRMSSVLKTLPFLVPAVLAGPAQAVAAPAVAAPGLGRAGQEYELKGRVTVLSCSPHNPTGKRLHRTRLVATVERGNRGTAVVLRMPKTGQSCRFEARPAGRGAFELTSDHACTFRALSAPGAIRFTRSRLEVGPSGMRLAATVEVRWWTYDGLLDLAVAGPARR